jgi:hypothetical protein
VTVVECDAIRRAGRFLFLNRRTGGITVVQWPNIPLGVYIVATVVLRLFHPKGTFSAGWHLVGTAALIVWALDEIVRGVNPFRRGFGAVVLVATVVGLIAG